MKSRTLSASSQDIPVSTKKGSIREPAMQVNSPASSAGPQRTRSHVSRPRTSYSCHCCRARRVKCDKVHPVCGRCLKDGATCTYDKHSNARTSGSRTVRKKRLSPSARIKSSRDTVRNTPDDRETSRSISPKGKVPDGESDSLPGLGYLSVQNGGRSRYVGRSFWAYVGDDNELEMLLQDQDRHCRPESANPSLEAVCPSCHCIRDRNTSTSPADSSLAPDHQRRPLWQEELSRNRIKAQVQKPSGQYANDLPNLLEDLPSKETCDLLYRSFVISIHTILPLLHLPSFDEQYQKFWTWIEKREKNRHPIGILAETPSFLPLLFAVLFGGSVSCPNEVLKSQFKFASRAAISSGLCEAAMRTQSLVAFPRNPTIYSLMSFLIVQNLLVREEEPLASCSYISVALRVAQAMGLHRDGSNFGLKPIESEIRRRIWWHIIHTDVMTALPSALPPSNLSDSIYDTKMICELKDRYIGTPTCQDFECAISLQNNSPTETTYSNTQRIYPDSVDPNIMDVRHMVAVDRYSITSMMRRIIRRQFDTAPLTKDDFSSLKDKVEMLDIRIGARVVQLSRICHAPTGAKISEMHDNEKHGSSYEEGFDERAFGEWAQLLLKLMIHKTYCVLYQPLVRDSNHDMWAQVRPNCVYHCQRYIHTFLEMCTSDPFRPYHWLYPGLYQPLHAAVVLLSDLLRKPQSAEAEQSRILIDKMFSLISPNDGVVSEEDGVLTERHLSEGGREAWALLRRLRRKAWENMGLDPDILWTDNSWNGAMSRDFNSEERQSSSRQGDMIPTSSSPAEQVSTTSELETSTDTGSQAFGTSFDSLVGSVDMGFDASEYSEYFIASDPSQFNWMEWDAAMSGSFDGPSL